MCLLATPEGKETPMTFSHEEHQEIPGTSMPTSPLPGRIHWTAVVSFGLGLFFVVWSAAVVFFSETFVGNSIWHEISTTGALFPFAPVLYTVILAGVLYALVGWIFGLV